MALVIPLTATGVELSVVVPSPSWPYPFQPQQATPPPASRAQVSLEPAVIAVAVVIPLTATGVELVTPRPDIPLPSSPYWLSPQQVTPPPARRAQVWS